MSTMPQLISNIPDIVYPSDNEQNRVEYFGDLKNGIPNGHGTMTWRDGQIYKGSKKSNQTILK
jgi:hypothetical protein